MMNKWEVARYLIDAKKNIDSIMYINKNIYELNNIDVNLKIRDVMRSFYLNLSYVLDEKYDTRDKKQCICRNNKIIESIYYERDKDKAHKDSNYQRTKYDSIEEIIETMKKQIFEVRKKCEDIIAKEVTLDFVPHDKELFRIVNGINREKEYKICRKKYFISDSLNENNITRKIFYDTEELKENREKDKYAVIMKDGINIYEGIQERQDACIKVNVLNNTNIWVQFNSKSKKKIEKLIKTGLVNKYGIPLSYEEMSQEQWKVFTKIIKNEEGEKIE